MPKSTPDVEAELRRTAPDSTLPVVEEALTPIQKLREEVRSLLRHMLSICVLLGMGVSDVLEARVYHCAHFNATAGQHMLGETAVAAVITLLTCTLIGICGYSVYRVNRALKKVPLK